MGQDSDDEDELFEQALADMERNDGTKGGAATTTPTTATASSSSSGIRAQAPAAASRPSTAGTPPQGRAAPSRPHHKQQEEDELSEVEMLSISSEDDEPVKKGKDVPSKGDKAARDDFSEMDEFDDDDEPHVWKAVDEQELVRRVREMRETRAPPTADPLRMKRSSTIYDVHQDLVDPLGLGAINLKTMNLVKNEIGSPASAASGGGSRSGRTLIQSMARMKKDSDMSSQGDLNLPQSPSGQDSPAARDASSRERLLYYSEKFDPKYYLARIHRDTPSSELEAGDMALRRDLQNRREQLKKLVKENFDCFISCKNTIDDIHLRLQAIEMDREGAGTIQLSNNITEVDEVAKRAFGPLLERQAQAERIRSVQGLLSRFRTLFNLPSNIRMHIKKGEHDLVVREYRKAKSLIVPSQAGILRRVFEEVEKLVQEFREMLYRSMEGPSVEVSEVENTVRLLLDLEPDSDPIWHYLSIQDRRIRAMLEACSHEHETRMDALLGRVRERVQTEQRWKQMQQESSKGSDVDMSVLLGEQSLAATEAAVSDAAGEEVDALLGRLIRRLTSVLVRHVPSFWQLSLSIFSGKFGRVTPPDGSSLTTEPLPQKKGPPGRYGQFYAEEEVVEINRFTTKHTQDEVADMVLGIVTIYETKVQSAFSALAEAMVLRPNMEEAIGEITSAITAFRGKDCAPNNAVAALYELRRAVTHRFVLRLCSLMRSTTPELAEDEDWVPVPSSARNGTVYTISSFPLRFAEMLAQALQHLQEGLEKVSSGVEDDGSTGTTVLELQAAVKNTFFECFLDFVEMLQKLASELPQTAVSMPSQEGGDESAAGSGAAGEGGEEEGYQGLRAGVELATTHQKMLMLLSNCGYVRYYLLPTLTSRFHHLWALVPLNHNNNNNNDNANMDISQEAMDALADLEEQLLNLYLDTKAALLGPAVAAYLLEDGTVWAAAPPVKGLRDVALELMHPLVIVHAEVYAGARPWVERAISVLAEALMHVLQTICSNQIIALDANGYCQLCLELDYIETVLEAFSTPAMDETVAILRAHLLEKASSGDPQDAPARRGSRASSGDLVALELQDGPAMGVPPSTPEDVQALANSISQELLTMELKRTRINTICFTESQPSDEHGIMLPGSHRPLPLPDPRSLIMDAQRAASPPRGTRGGRPSPSPTTTTPMMMMQQPLSVPAAAALSQHHHHHHQQYGGDVAGVGARGVASASASSAAAAAVVARRGGGGGGSQSSMSVDSSSSDHERGGAGAGGGSRGGGGGSHLPPRSPGMPPPRYAESSASDSSSARNGAGSDRYSQRQSSSGSNQTGGGGLARTQWANQSRRSSRSNYDNDLT